MRRFSLRPDLPIYPVAGLDLPALHVLDDITKAVPDRAPDLVIRNTAAVESLVPKSGQGSASDPGDLMFVDVSWDVLHLLTPRTYDSLREFSHEP